MQPHNLEHRFAAPFRQAPAKWVYDHLGGQVMTFIWVGLTMAFIIALKKPDALIGFAGVVTGLGGVLAYRAVGEDKYVIQTKLNNGGIKP